MRRGAAGEVVAWAFLLVAATFVRGAWWLVGRAFRWALR